MPAKRKKTSASVEESAGNDSGPIKVVLPGDRIPVASIGEVLLGPGTRWVSGGEADADGVTTPIVAAASKFGALCQNDKTGAVWVNNSQKRYVPVKGERVIGIVVGRPAEVYSVDLGCARHATLPHLAFEGATKRNRPNLEIGDVVYARVVASNKDIEPELSCVSASGKANGLEKLVGGYVIQCSIGLCRKLLQANCPILVALGKRVAYEIVVGLNGRVWINAGSMNHVIMISNAIQSSEDMTHGVALKFVDQLLLKFSS